MKITRAPIQQSELQPRSFIECNDSQLAQAGRQLDHLGRYVLGTELFDLPETPSDYVEIP